MYEKKNEAILKRFSIIFGANKITMPLYYSAFYEIVLEGKKERERLKIFKINEIDEMANVLMNDGIISVPTDTVYGVCARINSKKAHDNLTIAKNRPINKLFPIMCADMEQIESIAIINENARILIKSFMPGPITIIMKKKDNLAKYINNGSETIAIRMATSKELEKLIKKVGPVFMSSANQSGEPICRNLNEIEKSCTKINGMMEGNVTFGISSTIVDCSTRNIKIIRSGPITEKQIMDALKK